jgi:hypothetical protein
MKTDTYLSRRRFISRAAKTFLGVSALPAGSLLSDSTLRAAGAGASPLRQIPTAKRVIYLYMNGGMSHLDTFDPKPGQEVMGPTGVIRSKADGQRISEYLPRTARQMDKVAVINSMYSTQGAHKQGNYFMHTSYELRSSIRHPAMGAWALKFQGAANPSLPANVMIGNESSHPGAGFFESRFSPLMINNPEEGLRNSTPRRGVSEADLAYHLDLSAQLDRGFVEKYGQKNVQAYTDMYADAVRLMQSRDLVAFDISKEPEGLRARYGKNSFGQGCLLARRLAEHDVRFIEVSLGGWDTHNANFVNVPENADILDNALATLLDDLERRGLLDDTLVAVATEFGRTPEINPNEGRDHHPAAFTCLLAGGGIRGGQFYGKTNDSGSEVVENRVKVPDYNATIAYALGLPLDTVLFSPSKRPFTLADKGQPIVELFG